MGGTSYRAWSGGGDELGHGVGGRAPSRVCVEWGMRA